MLARVEGSVRRRSWWQVHRCLTDPVARRNCEYKMASRQDFEFVLFRLPCTFCVLGEGFSTERKVSPLSLRGTTFTIKCDALFSLFLSQVLDFTIDDRASTRIHHHKMRIGSHSRLFRCFRCLMLRHVLLSC